MDARYSVTAVAVRSSLGRSLGTLEKFCTKSQAWFRRRHMTYKNLQNVAQYEQICWVTSCEWWKPSKKAKFLAQNSHALYFSQQLSSTRNACFCCTTNWSHKVKNAKRRPKTCNKTMLRDKLSAFVTRTYFAAQVGISVDRSGYGVAILSYNDLLSSVTPPLSRNVYWPLSRVFAIHTDSTSIHVSLTHARALSKLLTLAFAFS